MSVDWSTTSRRHGSYSGYCLHQELGERPCDACYAARAEHDKRWRAAPEPKRRNRFHATAQGRARVRLTHMYPEQYKALYEEEKARLIEEQEAS